MVNVKSRLVGFIKGGKWNKDARKFEIGKFKTANGFGLNLAYGISKKNQDDSRTYGLDVPVTVWLDNKEQFDAVVSLMENLVVIEGYFTPNNYKKEDKEIKGHQFNVNFADIFAADGFAEKPKSVEIVHENISETDDIPF